ncbi:MAG: hypothetical protein CME63_07145 [Halobacteriovoraceae bacterium]|nr:hypothetical protein [Halobacteriovoraceae bacterium]
MQVLKNLSNLKKITPLMMATFLLSPGLLMESAYAQIHNEQIQNIQKKQSGEIALKNFDSYFKPFIGTPSFQLTDDPEVRRLTGQFEKAHDAYKNSTEELDLKNKELTDARLAKDKLAQEISEVEKKIITALSEKTKLEQQLPNLRKQLQNLSATEQVAQAAHDTTQAQLQTAKETRIAAKQELEKVQQSCEANPSDKCANQIKKATQRFNQAKRDQNNAQRVFNIAKKDLDTKKKNKENKAKQIVHTQETINRHKAENTKRAEILNQKQTQMKRAQVRIQVANRNLIPARNQFQQKLKERNQIVSGLNQLKERIAIRAVRLNKIGSEVGQDAGSIDGDYYAEYIGVPRGQRDGDRDGREAGTSAGQNNSYQQGLSQGEVEGRSQAQIDGFDHGKEEGTKAGLMAIATKEGERDGLARAQASDADQVGMAQGQADGLQRATQTGKKLGSEKGQNQAIEINEKKELKKINISGQFAGAFAALTPNYPGFNCIRRGSTRFERDQYEWRGYNDWRADRNLCPNFKPREHSEMVRANRAIFKKAFMDGYLVRYRGSRREQFVRSIDHYYSPSYSHARNASYADFSTRTYPDFLERGRAKGYTTAYNTTYPSVKERYYNDFYNSSFQNPDRSHSIYSSTYRRVESNNFETRYEQIRASVYASTEQNTFDQNIKEQTEIFRKKRFDEVNQIYKDAPILKFDKTEVKDAGISGVAQNDGIFQPAEKINHDLTLINYGQAAAQAVTLKIGSQVFKVPSIAPQSKVTVKGVAQTDVTTGLGQTHTLVAKVISPLSHEASIQGRHFYSPSSGTLNYGDKKTLKIQYPISLTGMRTQSDLLINNKNNLQVSLSNISKRKYTGKLEIDLSVNSQTDIITRPFSALNGLTGTVTLNDAELLVASERDVYSELKFGAKIRKNGVVIGVLPGHFETMAKAPFSNKAGKPVLLVDSDKSATDLLKVVNSYGGLSQISVLDISLNRLNQSVLAQGLDKKSILVIDDNRGSTAETFGKVLSKLEDSSIVFVDYSARGLNQALARTKEMKYAAKLPTLINGFSSPVQLHFTNPFISGSADMNVVAQANMENYKEMVKALSQYNYTKNEIIPSAGSVLTKANYKKTNSKVRTLISMAAAEVVNASLAYKASGNNEKMVDFIKSGSPIFQRVLNQSGKKVKNSTLSKNLAAISMWKVLDKAVDSFGPMEDNVAYDIESEFEDAMKDMMQGEGLRIFSKGTWNYLKDYDRGLYNTVDDQPYVHSPFQI